MYKRSSQKSIIQYFLLYIIILCFCFLSVKYYVDFLFVVLMIIWIIMFFLALFDIKNNVVVICFLIAFFVFLMGRQFTYAFFEREEVYSFLNKTNHTTYIAMITSLIGIEVGIIINKIIRINKSRFFIICDIPFLSEFSTKKKAFALSCKCMYYFCVIFSFYAVYKQIIYVRTVGYYGSYTGEGGGAGIPGVVSYFSSFTPVAICMYLSCLPSKKATFTAFFFYEIYAVMTLFTGQRFPFMGINLFMMSYFFIRGRRERGWIKKEYYILILVAIPLLMVFMTAYDAIRIGSQFSFHGITNSIIDFLDQQGGSINTIRRVINNASDFEDMKFVSFSGTYSAIFENVIGRNLFGIQSYSGNTIDSLKYSHNISHRLSYIAYGDAYFNGRGAGSSYIAELFHDFGFFGVFIGSIFYGWFMKRTSEMKFDSRIKNGIELAMIYYILLAPRGSYDAFVNGIFRIYSILLFLSVWAFSLIVKRFIKRIK